ncbi:hypothetical protein ACQRUO_31520, partial [Kitasatospora sp. LaBMicrA B282]
GGPAAPSAGGPGELSESANGVSVQITDARVHPAAAGGGELTMTVHNSGSVPEHLALVLPAGGGQATVQDPTAPGAGVTQAGVLLKPGSTTTFGAQGPRVLLQGAPLPPAGQSLTVKLEFGVLGMVTLQAPVTP